MNTRHLQSLDRLNLGLSPYTIVRIKGKEYLRLRRGWNTPVELNEVFARNAQLLDVCAPASKRIRLALHYYLHYLRPGYLGAKLAAALRRGYKAEGKLDLKWIKGFEMQESHPLQKRLNTDFHILSGEDTIAVELPIYAGSVRKINQHEVKFYFELAMLYGDCSKDNNLRITESRSEIWSFNQFREDAPPFKYLLKIDKPPADQPWVLLLKVSVILDDPLDEHPMNHGMRVIASHTDKFD